MRDHWIIFLLTINDRLFAMPIPKVVPQKILAQYEEADLKKRQSMYPVAPVSGIEKKYLSIADQRTNLIQKDTIKNEGGIQPDLHKNTVVIGDKKNKKRDQNPYEQHINGRIQSTLQNSENGFPKITFEAKEFYD
jgi:hypothetical protein